MQEYIHKHLLNLTLMNLIVIAIFISIGLTIKALTHLFHKLLVVVIAVNFPGTIESHDDGFAVILMMAQLYPTPHFYTGFGGNTLSYLRIIFTLMWLSKAHRV